MPLTTLILGVVVGITDGDTLTVLTPEKQEVRVRLAEIDTPEHNQAFGKKAKQLLSDLCYGKTAEVVLTGKQHRSRVLGRVKCDGVDVHIAQVQAGMAWVDPRYATDVTLFALYNEARTAQRGLWADPSPIPPWEFRKAQRAK